MLDLVEVDLDDQSSIIQAASKFDSSYEPGKPVMLAQSEIVRFIRHAGGWESKGRRSSDRLQAKMSEELQRENERLRAEVAMLKMRIGNDRRLQSQVIAFPDRRQSAR